ncbi:unnamed protein product [Rotaria sordida]|uniref:Uncharacterized protein n=1 Tax=Rotaria sordida TaxID=392033 RepID=A0A818T2R2_9BILA|nr:unnamed protein product [Rotaria sordida]
MAGTIIPADDIYTNANDSNLETLCLIWLDANVNVKYIQDTERQLCSIINRFKTFQNVEQCQKYIERRSQQDQLVIVTSGRLGQVIVPSIHKLRQVLSIYVYCTDKKSNKKWADKFSKMKDVVINLDKLIARIKADHRIQRKIEEPLVINIFTTNFGKGKSTSGVNGKFVFSQVFIDCLLRLKSTETDKNELINHCKQQYEGNSNELKNINEFEKTYSPDKVLWWYSRESFFYNTLNAVLRNAKTHLVFLFRSFICDMYHQLKKYQITHSLQVYRCQMISSDELETLKQSIGQLISVNSFFSTSTDYAVAVSYLKDHHVKDNLESVLFEINADPKMATTKPFADIMISNTPVNVQWAQNGVIVAGGYGNGHSSYQLCFPHGFFIDDDQTMVIADNGNNRIVQWKVGGKHGKVMAGDRGPGNRLDQLNQPTDVIIDKATDSLIICDGDNRRLLRWSRRNDTNQGEILLDNVRCYGLAMDDQRYLYISDTKHNEVRRYQLGDKKGIVVAGGNGKGANLNQLNIPTYIFVDKQQAVYVSERHNHRVTKWNKDATAGIIVAGGQGQGQALTQLSQPEGLFVDPLGTVYVVDSFNNRVMCWPQGATQGTLIIGGNGRGQEANQLNGSMDRSDLLS